MDTSDRSDRREGEVHLVIPSLIDLLARWEVEAKLFQRRGQEGVATLIRSLAEEVTLAVANYNSETLTLKAAAAESGFSVDHLSRLLRAGRIQNAGRKHLPRIRRADLPIRVASQRGGGYDPDADAQNLLTQRGTQ